MADETVIYKADHVLEYPFVRSVGPVIGAFLTGLRDGKVVGIKGAGARSSCPPPSTTPRPVRRPPTWWRWGPRAP